MKTNIYENLKPLPFGNKTTGEFEFSILNINMGLMLSECRVPIHAGAGTFTFHILPSNYGLNNRVE